MKWEFWVCLFIMLGIGFGFQILFLTKIPTDHFISVVIPLGFAKMWWDTKEKLSKEKGEKDK